jgi:hypothetical protein
MKFIPFTSGSGLSEVHLDNNIELIFIMISRLPILLLGLFPSLGVSQYCGGTGDGYHKLDGSIDLNENAVYCYGGINDGACRINSEVYNNNPSFYFKGSSSDGYAATRNAVKVNYQTYYVFGGSGDGFASQKKEFLKNDQSFVFGGTGDGFVRLNASNLRVNLFNFPGGNGDGFASQKKEFLKNDQSFVFGGTGDGFVRLNASNLRVNLFNFPGGNGDGFSSQKKEFLKNDQSFVFGGTGDGFAIQKKELRRNDQSSTFGGTGDGFVRSSAEILRGNPYYSMGGPGDGFVTGKYDRLRSNLSYAYGGKGDGHSNVININTLLGPGIWKGTASTEWTNTLNWLCNMVPDHTISVIIPSGCIYYPSLAGLLTVNFPSGGYTCRNLDILSGGSIITTGGLSVNGNMIVKGNYTAINNTDGAQVINNGGRIELDSTANVKFGNQESGQGLSDLIINEGGNLTIHGGNLEIDDQFNLYSGGTFAMSGGTLFTHKFGLGSEYDSNNPGAFYVATGALGNVADGIVKACGRSTNGLYSAIKINSPEFTFSGTSTLEITRGISSANEDMDIICVTGAGLMNLVINKPNATVSLASDATIDGKIIIYPQSTLKINPGVVVTVRDSVIIRKN